MQACRDAMRPHMSRPRIWIALLVGLAGVASALALPFAPVVAGTTTLTWPAPGRPPVSSTVLMVPYRPQELTVSLPCPVLRAAADRPTTVTVLSTGEDGLTVTGGPGGVRLRTGDRTETLPVPPAPADCRISIETGPSGISVLQADGRVTYLVDQPVPEVFGLHTGLDPVRAQGLSVTAEIGGPFGTTPTTAKAVLVAVQLVCAVAALTLLLRGRVRRPRLRWTRLWWIDIVVITVLCGWAVIGPLAVDDGWATTIARTVTATGDPGNYYRWWNAAEVPFALSQELLAPLTRVSLAPLWLRVPSTLLAVATWFVLSRGLLGAALPRHAATGRVRLLAALCLLVTWLPFNLGTRPESYVALGVTAALALAWRTRGPAGLGLLALVVALTVPISPTGVLVAAPMLIFADRLRAAVRACSRLERAAIVASVCSVGAVALTVIFADQTWDALVTATQWHNTFGPSLPWYEEPTRYRYLLQADQQGSMAKRLPVLVTIALLPITGVAALVRRDRTGAATLRLVAVVVLMLALFATGPSKWSYHFGAGAGVFAAFLTVATVLLARRARAADRVPAAAGVVGSALLAGAAALAFTGPDAWWLPVLYDVPWPSSPVRPAGVPLDDPLLWAAVLAAGVATLVLVARTRPAQALAAGPAVLTLVSFGTVLVLLLGSFAAAPLRRSAGSLAMVNLNRLASTRVCGLADDIELLPDGEVLTATESVSRADGFTAGAGYVRGAPPPDRPGTGTSSHLWGSRTPDESATGTITTRWFMLPPLAPNAGVALSVSGRTSDGNALTLEFGRADGNAVAVLGSSTPVDRPAADEVPTHPLWRSIGVDAAEVPAGADRVRVRAADGRTDEQGWLAFTGPRLRSTVPLTAFLAANGPVLISWPQSFLFPCVHNIAQVAGGLAQTPRTVIESPRPWFTEDRDPAVGGTFAGLTGSTVLNEIPSRVVGHPELDWGTVRVVDTRFERDSYARSTTRATVWGIGATARRPRRRGAQRRAGPRRGSRTRRWRIRRWRWRRHAPPW